jgi:phenylacetic acid degradation operon negative regulatory protein
VSVTLTARSVVLSVLLGTDPPRLPVRLLVSTTELFGIAEGTTRTALSRMTRTGELAADDGWYAIADPRLLDRQTRQSFSRRGVTQPWSGSWLQAVVTSTGRRPADERAMLRDRLRAARLAELREGIWLRPDNVGARPNTPAVDDVAVDDVAIDRQVMWFDTMPADPHALAARLWDLDAWAATANELLPALDRLTPRFESGDRTDLAVGFVVSADVLRHLQADPLLPRELWPARWPGPPLRRAYERYDAAYRAVLRAWFDEHR